MKKLTLMFLLLLCCGFIYGETETMNDPQAYTIYQQANDQYKLKKTEEAKNLYLQLINQYPDSRFVPYSIYMLSFIDTDYVKIIDYLSIIKDRYPDFRYWTNTIEKLGDIFYIMGNHIGAIDQYKTISTDRALYMLSLIYSANGFQDNAIESANKLLLQTKDNGLAYKGFLVLTKIYLDMGKFNEVYPLLQQSLKLKKFAFDNCARILFYSGKYYFYQKKIVNHYEKSLYIFSMLRTNFPLSIESSLAVNYMNYFKTNNIVKTETVGWIADAFAAPVEIPYQNQTLSVMDEAEQNAEEVSSQAEGAAGNMVKSDFIEYVVRIGEYKDLSVANLVAQDIVRSGQTLPLGIYYRNDLYYAEIRGIKKLEEAKEYAKKMIAIGYNDTKVVEFYKVVEYNK